MQKNKERQIKEVPAGCSEEAVSKKDRRIERIRARASYLLFQQLYNFLASKPAIVDILRKFYYVLDAKGGFGNIRNAEYAEESLDLVLKDNGVYK